MINGTRIDATSLEMNLQRLPGVGVDLTIHVADRINLYGGEDQEKLVRRIERTIEKDGLDLVETGAGPSLHVTVDISHGGALEPDKELLLTKVETALREKAALSRQPTGRSLVDTWRHPLRFSYALATSSSKSLQDLIEEEVLFQVGTFTEMWNGANPQRLMRDDLTLIMGVGPRLATRLTEFGIFSFEDLAQLGEDRIDELDREFRGRIRRGEWVEQARELAQRRRQGDDDEDPADDDQSDSAGN